jgi:hypothetical protein
MHLPDPEVALRAGHRCEYGHAPEAVCNLPLEVEHIVPLARGGEDTAANWALTCRAGNLYKAASVSGPAPASAAMVRLFHPRADRWDDHGHVAPESGELVGRTPIGRATVMRLGLNSAAQVAARRQWMRLGLFP